MTDATPSPKPTGRRSPFLAYIVLATLVAAIVWGLAHAVVTAEREQRLEVQADKAHRIASFFERNTRNVFRYGDAYLKMVRREWLRSRDLDEVRSLMRDVPLDQSIASHVTIIDAHGTPLLVSGHKIKPGTSASDRDYFKHAREHEEDDLHISLPHRGRNSGKLIVRLVRRVDAPGGGFRGVVFTALEAASMTEFFSALQLGPNSSATLVGNDRRIRARSSYGELGPGQDISGSRIWRELEQSPSGLYRQTSVVDGVTRYYAYRQLSEFPLVVAIGVATDDIEAALSRFARTSYLIALLLTLTIAAIALVLGREVWARRQVAAGEARVRAVVDTVLDGILTLDPRGTIVSVSDNAQAILGYRRSELIGHSITTLAAQPEDPVSTGLFTGNGETARTGYVEAILRRGDGGTFPAELSIGVTGSDERRVWVLTVRDISERVENEQTILRMHEELEERVRARTAELEAVQADLLKNERMVVLGQLTGTVAHELRNPLATVMASAKVIERRVENSGLDLSGPMKRIERNVNRCNGIITELLDVARARGLDRQVTPIDVFVGEVLDELAMPPDVSVERRFEAGDRRVSLDRERMRRVLVNLMENARDAVSDVSGEQRIVVSTRIDGDRVHIHVDDNGSGIAAERLDQIREPLFSTKSFGVGLGLSVVAGVMEEHGGGFEIDNRTGGGARASVWLPLPAPGGDGSGPQ